MPLRLPLHYNWLRGKPLRAYRVAAMGLSRSFKYALTVDGNDAYGFVGIVWARRYSCTGVRALI
jgi:hypothetical protein